VLLEGRLKGEGRVVGAFFVVGGGREGGGEVEEG
jgi:hypothetical protein